VGAAARCRAPGGGGVSLWRGSGVPAAAAAAAAQAAR
jgi:hypothetical protein